MWELLVLQTSYERKQKGNLRKTLAGCAKKYLFLIRDLYLSVSLRPCYL